MITPQHLRAMRDELQKTAVNPLATTLAATKGVMAAARPAATRVLRKGPSLSENVGMKALQGIGKATHRVGGSKGVGLLNQGISGLERRMSLTRGAWGTQDTARVLGKGVIGAGVGTAGLGVGAGGAALGHSIGKRKAETAA